MTVSNINIEHMKEDMEKYHAFLLEHDIDVFSQEISFEFLRIMIPFSGIVGDNDCLRGVCHLLKHKAKYNDVEILKVEE